jgi:hypothetical protein
MTQRITLAHHGPGPGLAPSMASSATGRALFSDCSSATTAHRLQFFNKTSLH